jgi:hypothetical protein
LRCDATRPAIPPLPVDGASYRVLPLAELAGVAKSWNLTESNAGVAVIGHFFIRDFFGGGGGREPGLWDVSRRRPQGRGGFFVCMSQCCQEHGNIIVFIENLCNGFF